MNKTTTTARIRPDGRVVKVSQGGKETPFSDMPMHPMTEARVKAAANADPDARHVPMGTFDRTLAKLEGAERIAA